MPNTSQYSPNVTGKVARCFKSKLEFLLRIDGVRAISIERPIQKPKGKKLIKAKKKVWKEEGVIRNRIQYIIWHNAWIKQRFMLIF